MVDRFARYLEGGIPVTSGEYLLVPQEVLTSRGTKGDLKRKGLVASVRTKVFRR